MRIVNFMAAATLAVLSIQPAFADKPPEEAQTIRTVFIAKGNSSAVTKAMNAMHAKMEAEGWTYRDMGVYTEDGDLAGLFVTYVRTAPAPAN